MQSLEQVGNYLIEEFYFIQPSRYHDDGILTEPESFPGENDLLFSFSNNNVITYNLENGEFSLEIEQPGTRDTLQLKTIIEYTSQLAPYRKYICPQN